MLEIGFISYPSLSDSSGCLVLLFSTNSKSLVLQAGPCQDQLAPRLRVVTGDCLGQSRLSSHQGSGSHFSSLPPSLLQGPSAQDRFQLLMSPFSSCCLHGLANRIRSQVQPPIQSRGSGGIRPGCTGLCPPVSLKPPRLEILLPLQAPLQTHDCPYGEELPHATS